ncbi:hypothetical protein NIES4071_77290 [Calothrix sp. NIES-4071]|nr:hypothetical protein NIES4071_77290 [Calothrix sp. NIES-4071]BAZ62002.1 hypothetical protein NIES4105_77230 [Calothrix sp. NIES-4105]
MLKKLGLYSIGSKRVKEQSNQYFQVINLSRSNHEVDCQDSSNSGEKA